MRYLIEPVANVSHRTIDATMTQPIARPGDLTSVWPNHDYCYFPAPNSCALNCRAVGERFYATLEPTVMDGTPCDAPNLRGRGGISMERNDERWLCVAGQCKVRNSASMRKGHRKFMTDTGPTRDIAIAIDLLYPCLSLNLFDFREFPIYCAK